MTNILTGLCVDLAKAIVTHLVHEAVKENRWSFTVNSELSSGGVVVMLFDVSTCVGASPNSYHPEKFVYICNDRDTWGRSNISVIDVPEQKLRNILCYQHKQSLQLFMQAFVTSHTWIPSISCEIIIKKKKKKKIFNTHRHLIHASNCIISLSTAHWKKIEIQQGSWTNHQKNIQSVHQRLPEHNWHPTPS